jgi:hypothetical protein
MLKILTDEQINLKVAAAAKKRCRAISIVSLFDWLDGHFVGASDEELLKEAARRSVTLVSFDLKTISPLLRDWGERGIDHGGVIFVDNKTFAQNDISGISKALASLWELRGRVGWTNRCFFMTNRRKPRMTPTSAHSHST